VNTYQFIAMMPVVQHINTGKLRALAVMARKRVAALKDVPTIVEAGSPPPRFGDWGGFMVKAGPPPATVARLNEAINKALKTDKLRDALAKLGTDPGGGTPEAFGPLMNGEIARWTKVIKDAGIKINT